MKTKLTKQDYKQMLGRYWRNPCKAKIIFFSLEMERQIVVKLKDKLKTLKQDI